MSLFDRPGSRQAMALLLAIVDAVRERDAAAAHAAVGCAYLHSLTDMEVITAIDRGRAETPEGVPPLDIDDLRQS